ncbi:hypothetical protein PTI98_013472 [Pleurotus ostreatus]|nr:hypothetical protein PTI98_013472 [Pleurotus ostreatus]
MSQRLCRYIVYGGPDACKTPNCRFSHVLPVCETCGDSFASQYLLDKHLNSKQHIRRVRGETSAVLFCPLCQRYISGTRLNWEQHVAGIAHRTQAVRQGIVENIEPQVADEVLAHTLCVVCNRQILTRSWPQHIQAMRHKDKERFLSYRTAMDEAERDKNGVVVSGSLAFDVIDSHAAADGRALSLSVENGNQLSFISIVGLKVVNQPSPFSARLQGHTNLAPGKSVQVHVTFRQTYTGRYHDRVDILFEDSQLKKRFTISRPLTAIVGNKEDHDMLRPKTPFVPQKRLARQPEVDVVPPELPASTKAVPYVVPLPLALIPRHFSNIFTSGSYAHVLHTIRKSFLPQSFNSESYGRHFKHLLWTEEFQSERDMEIYDMQGVKMNFYRPNYYLEVPGLAEKRPSVLVGDIILVQACGAPRGHWFSGGVHFVRKLEVGLRFNPAFHWHKDQLYNVRFKYNRYPLRRQHQAMESAFSPERLLFPASSHLLIDQVPVLSLRIENPLIGENAPQKQAVMSIVKQPPGSAPFVIFGPPGTGKTVTMVEAILQVLWKNRTGRILACAPSNSAADLIAQRLSPYFKSDELFRFYAPSRQKDTIPDSLLKHTYTMSNGQLSVPPLATMKRFRVVVATCVSASFAHGIGMPRGHFSHIFVDEAGQATEPEVMVPIKTMGDNETNIILSGDPKQLGPIIRSKFARDLGLDTSYIERLMDRPLYDYHTGHGISVVKLVKNFRSHQAILKFPNERFYHGELQECGPRSVIDSFIGWRLLPSKKFPVIFHAISGKDDREASSPSFFNIDEATEVKNYVNALRSDRQLRLTDKDIGVVTPYHAQVLKIRAVLRAFADEVKVASVEEFQGQERKVMIISTVRSSREFVEYDLRHTLGFVANPRRFNVAVTRAQALLIVVGDPGVLSLDPLWHAFMNYVYLNGGWRGPEPSWDPRDPTHTTTAQAMREKGMNELSDTMEALTLAATGEGTVEEQQEQIDANVDRPWRDVE